MFGHHAPAFGAPLHISRDEPHRDIIIPPRQTPPEPLPHPPPPPIFTAPMLVPDDQDFALSSSGSDALPPRLPIDGLVRRMRRQTLRHDDDDDEGLPSRPPLPALHRSASTLSIPPIPAIPEPLVVDDADDDFDNNVLEVDPDLYLDPDHDMGDSAADELRLPALGSLLRPRVPSKRGDPTINSRIESYLDSIIMAPYQPVADLAPAPPSPKTATPPSASLSEFEMPIVPDLDARLGYSELDEGFCDDQNQTAWMESLIASRSMRFLSGQAPTGIRKRYPNLLYRSSQDAAMQCPNVVRNVPRMRRRKGDKPRSKSSRSRATSAASSAAPRVPHAEASPQLPFPEPLSLSAQQEFHLGIASPTLPPPATTTTSSPRKAGEASTPLELPCIMEIEAEIGPPQMDVSYDKMEQLPPPPAIHEPLMPLEPESYLQPAQEPAMQPLVEDHGLQ